MDVKEFRIGNLLHDREGRLCRVEQISLSGIVAPAIVGPRTALPNKPIEINQTELEAIGLKYSHGEYSSVFEVNPDDGLLYFTGGDGQRFGNGMKYIHEVQNLYYDLYKTPLTRNVN